MKNRNTYYSTSKQRFSWALVLFFCLFVSSIEYFPSEGKQSRTEQSSEKPGQSFLDVAVDAVVPFALEVANTVFYLISQLFRVDFLVHLPQVAAWADTHFRVEKRSDGLIVESGVEKLSEQDRVEEIARMLAGLEESTSALEHAAELLAMRGTEPK